MHHMIFCQLHALHYTPQVLRILTLGSPTSKGGFFPDGINGRLNSSEGYNVSANAYKGYPGNKVQDAIRHLHCIALVS